VSFSTQFRASCDLTATSVTEDYSEYESVDEEEAKSSEVADKKSKKPAVTKKAAPVKSKPPEPVVKKVGQKNINNFFGKPVQKK
jgi:hypothetical protein